MSENEIIKIIDSKIVFSFIVAAIGWIIIHYFTSKRDLINKKREIRLKYLLDSYRILTNEISHRKMTDENKVKLENLLSDIQLYGLEQQIELAKNLANTVASSGSFDLDPLINSLRNELRKELNLEEVNDNVVWLRFNNKYKIN